jgi:hypothetical protein
MTWRGFTHEAERLTARRSSHCRLSKDTVTEEAQVSGEVRKEQIEQEGDISR